MHVEPSEVAKLDLCSRKVWTTHFGFKQSNLLWLQCTSNIFAGIITVKKWLQPTNFAEMKKLLQTRPQRHWNSWKFSHPRVSHLGSISSSLWAPPFPQNTGNWQWHWVDKYPDGVHSQFNVSVLKIGQENARPGAGKTPTVLSLPNSEYPCFHFVCKHPSFDLHY